MGIVEVFLKKWNAIPFLRKALFFRQMGDIPIGLNAIRLEKIAFIRRLP
jgi:hypothetical protein